MATVNLGNIKLNWKGAYNSSTAYIVDDVVSYNGSSYVCIQASTNNLPTVTTYWNQMSAKGTDGTDVAATLANKEISFKTNAGAMDGIPIGTAGQFLKVNSGATGYEYGDVSSDAVKIAEFAHTSGTVTNFDMDNIFSATYPYYKVIFHAVLHNSTGGQPWIRAIDYNGTADSSSAYEFANYGRQSDGSALTAQSTGQTYIALGNDLSSDTEKTSSFIINVFQPYQTSAYKWFAYHTAHYCNNSSGLRYFTGGGAWKNNTSQMRGLRYTGQGTNNIIKQFKAIVYGFKGAY